MGSVLWLDQVGGDDRAAVGAKAFTLALLRRHGLPVPDGYVVTAAAVEAEAAEAYARLGGTVAVRSSSTAEDTADASFAGQYRTVLEVRGESAVREAVRLCRDSAREAEPYARALGATAGSMAVLVQRWVEARAAGVAFTRHPRDARCLLVEAHRGGGDAVVSGAARPDRYVVDRTTGALREGPSEGSLEAGDLAAVVEVSRRAEALLGAPQDVEWARGAEGVVLLQSRPITVEVEAPRHPEVRRLTRANVGEVMPDPVTPLTWTTVGAFLEHGFRTVAREAGLLPEDAPAFLHLHRRRLYLNLSLSLEVAARLPGVSPVDAERLILGGRSTQGSSPQLRPSALAKLVRVAPLLFRLERRRPARIRAADELLSSLASRPAIERAMPGVLASMLARFAEVGRELATTHIATSGASAFRLALLGRLLPGPAAPERVTRLVAGLEDVESAAPALALETLAREAQGRADWLAWLSSSPPGAVPSLADAPTSLAERVGAFLERFGHRALSEGELRAAAWEDDPAPVLVSLRALVGTPGSLDFSRRARAEVRRADEEAIRARLGPLRRALFDWALRGARAGVRDRERTKAVTVRLAHHGRHLVRAAAAQLVRAGLLRQEDDVYFLEGDELGRALTGGPVTPAAVIERRRRRHRREGELPVPREVDLDAAGEEAGTAEAEGLRGIGVSGGVGAGPARVAVAGVTPPLEPGEVLVAPVLDAALGPLLATAAGAVAEIGGLLSHGSVVARELGVPCVVDVRDATRRIRTGERVLVDGGSGEVRLEAETTRRRDAGVMEGEDPAEEGLHVLESHPHARESVYFNARDPESGVALVGSLGVRPGGRGEALLALALPDGRVLFGLDLAPLRRELRGFSVGGTRVVWHPLVLSVSSRLSTHEAFPPPPLPLLLAPRTVHVRLELRFAPTTPAVDFCRGLSPEAREALRPLGTHHLEQSGAWLGEVAVDGRLFPFRGSGSRDHSWGRRDWEAADHWRLFTARLGDDLAVHALTVSVAGRIVEGGFVWRDGRAESIERLRYATRREGRRLRALELDVGTAAGRLRLRGSVERTLAVPVQVERRPSRHLAGRPYRLLLHENFTRYEAEGRVGHGIAELTERPA